MPSSPIVLSPESQALVQAMHDRNVAAGRWNVPNGSAGVDSEGNVYTPRGNIDQDATRQIKQVLAQERDYALNLQKQEAVRAQAAAQQEKITRDAHQQANLGFARAGQSVPYPGEGFPPGARIPDGYDAAGNQVGSPAAAAAQSIAVPTGAQSVAVPTGAQSMAVSDQAQAQARAQATAQAIQLFSQYRPQVADAFANAQLAQNYGQFDLAAQWQQYAQALQAWLNQLAADYNLS